MENKLEIQVVPYSPQWHTRLLDYMKKVYPHRNVKYFDWWLSNIDSGDERDWRKCIIVIEDNEIIGCTTAIPTEIINEKTRDRIYSRGNTIISQEKRGKGISKLLYEMVNSYNNWLSVGITDIAWAIQPKYVKSFTPIRPVRIYITTNIKVLGQLIKRLFNPEGKEEKSFVMPEQIKLKNNVVFVKINDVRQIVVPKNAHWTSDRVELIRDKDYFNNRFFGIYCANKYGVYRYEKNDKLEGYIVLRKMHYASLDMVSVVDYRFMDRKDERLAFAAANKLARKNHIGFVFGMTSRNYSVFGTPVLIRARKTLNCAVGTKEIDFSDMLVTSADSDLDFVYYN